MRYVLNHEGKKYRKFFEEIAAIPHESFKEKQLSDYIAAFAKERGLWYNQDQVWNVIVKKPASPGYEDHEPVMIQGHIDMVCVKTPESKHNFDTDPLELYVEGDFLKARGTTLGADCGHGISYMLAVLDDKELKHPPLECLFTVQEEVGIGGPKYLDYSLLTARRMIFTDSMGEGAPELSTTSVLGGNFRRKLDFSGVTDCDFYRIKVSGLSGGHAAVDINKGRANAIKILARVLYKLVAEGPVRICSFKGGTLKNNIPDSGEMVLAVPEGVDARAIVTEMDSKIKAEHRKTDAAPALSIESREGFKRAVTASDTKLVADWIMQIPSGTYMSGTEDPSFPLTSRNLGTAEIIRGEIVLGYMFRTSIKSHIEMLFDEQSAMMGFAGAYWEEEYQYPGYLKEPGSPMYEAYEKVYEAMTGKKLTPIHIHAGTDVGTIIEGMGGLDVVGIGPNTYKFHTPEECLDIASYDRAYKYITKLLENL